MHETDLCASGWRAGAELHHCGLRARARFDPGTHANTDADSNYNSCNDTGSYWNNNHWSNFNLNIDCEGKSHGHANTDTYNNDWNYANSNTVLPANADTNSDYNDHQYIDGDTNISCWNNADYNTNSEANDHKYPSTHFADKHNHSNTDPHSSWYDINYNLYSICKRDKNHHYSSTD